MLDTGASCSIINYRTFWEICQLQHPITIQKSTKVTKTYSGQTVPMIGYATLTFSYDPDGQFIFPLTVWLTEMRTQNHFGLDFCQKQVSGIHFDLPGIEIKNPPKSICYSSLHQNKPYPHLSQILLLEPLIRCILMLKVPVAGNIHPETLIYTSHPVLLFNQLEMLWLPAYLLQTLYAHHLKITFRF